MRIGFALLILFLVSAPTVSADTYKVSTAEFPEARAIAGLVKEVYREIGHDMELVFRPAKRSLVDVNSEKFDAELARINGAELEYPNLVRVEEPVFALSFSAIVKADSNIWLSSWDEMAKHRIGYPRGYRIMDIRTRNMKAVQAKDAPSIAKMVKGGRFDIGLIITSDAQKLASEDSAITVLTPPVETVTLYHYVNVKHRRLIPSIEDVLIKFNDSGRSKELLYQPK